MLVIGIDSNKNIHHADIDDADPDQPSKLHDKLKKATNQSDDFDTIIVIESDEIKSILENGTDFDPDESALEEDDGLDDVDMDSITDDDDDEDDFSGDDE